MPPKRIFKKVKNFSFFKKGGYGGQKIIFLEKYFQNQKGLKKLDTNHVPHAPKEDFQKK